MRISVEGDQLRVGPVDTQEADLAVRSSLAGVLAHRRRRIGAPPAAAGQGLRSGLAAAVRQRIRRGAGRAGRQHPAQRAAARTPGRDRSGPQRCRVHHRGIA
ncbi:hypothetical protein G6F23_015019 [Rhizopus arrhizus]|nr:hypothetical protein G6F23_015019 [Rhizopus arrhizus]